MAASGDSVRKYNAQLRRDEECLKPCRIAQSILLLQYLPG